MKDKILFSKVLHWIAWFFLLLSFFLPILRPSTPVWGVILTLAISVALISLSRKLKGEV